MTHFKYMAYFVLFSCSHSIITAKNFSTGCVVRIKTNRQILREVLLLETLNSLTEQNVFFNQGSHVAYREKCNSWIRNKERDSLKGECWDPLTNALQPAYQLLPQLLQWVPPYRRPVLGDGHIRLYRKKNPTVKWRDINFLKYVHTLPTTWGFQSKLMNLC